MYGQPHIYLYTIEFSHVYISPLSWGAHPTGEKKTGRRFWDVATNVVPQFVNQSHFTFGVMNGGYIYILTMVYKPTNITGGVPP